MLNSLPPSSPSIKDIEEAIVRAILPDAAVVQYEQGNIADSYLQPYADALLRMSKAYVAGNYEHALTPLEADAYALYYLLINHAKFSRLLAELPRPFLTAQSRILDFGCGPGTATFAVATAGLPALEFTAFDRSAAMIETFRKIKSATRWQAQVHTLHDEHAALSQKYDLALCGNVLCEVKPSARLGLLHKICQSLTPHGVLAILEPALQETSDALVRLRDAFIERCTDFAIVFPCTHHSPCPLAQSTKGPAWCHATLSWEVPQLVKQLDKLTGFGKHRLKYSALILQGGAKPSGGSRVITEPSKTKRGLECMVCSENGYERLIVPKKLAPRKLTSFDHLPDSH